MSKRNPDKDRYKILRVGLEHVLFQFMNGGPFKSVLKIPELPPDVEALSVHFDFERRAFSFLLRSDSFPVVSGTDKIPEFGEFGQELCTYVKISERTLNEMHKLKKDTGVGFQNGLDVLAEVAKRAITADPGILESVLNGLEKDGAQ